VASSFIIDFIAVLRTLGAAGKGRPPAFARSA